MGAAATHGSDEDSWDGGVNEWGGGAGAQPRSEEGGTDKGQGRGEGLETRGCGAGGVCEGSAGGGGGGRGGSGDGATAVTTPTATPTAVLMTQLFVETLVVAGHFTGVTLYPGYGRYITM